MSDPEVPQHEQKSDVDDVVDSANAGLAEAEAARADVNGTPAADADTTQDAVPADAADATTTQDATATQNEATADAVDPDLAAFEAAERDHPGTFAAPASASDEGGFRPAAAEPAASVAHDDSIADTAYRPTMQDDTDTRVVPSEPVVGAAAPAVVPVQQQPIFVQAPEPPRERGNRGTAGAIGLLAALAFAVLYLAAQLGFGALAGDVTADNLADAALAPLMTWGFWTPVVVFFIGFWLLGAIINRGRWGLWVVFGLLVGVAAYLGYILGQLFEAPFWLITASEASELVGQQLFTPLALAAFVLGRELTIWFGAWVARSGARKTELNDEAQREYERTLEAGPQLSR